MVFAFIEKLSSWANLIPSSPKQPEGVEPFFTCTVSTPREFIHCSDLPEVEFIRDQLGAASLFEFPRSGPVCPPEIVYSGLSFVAPFKNDLRVVGEPNELYPLIEASLLQKQLPVELASALALEAFPYAQLYADLNQIEQVEVVFRYVEGNYKSAVWHKDGGKTRMLYIPLGSGTWSAIPSIIDSNKFFQYESELIKNNLEGMSLDINPTQKEKSLHYWLRHRCPDFISNPEEVRVLSNQSVWLSVGTDTSKRQALVHRALTPFDEWEQSGHLRSDRDEREILAAARSVWANQYRPLKRLAVFIQEP